jgi:hypothetical protein
VPGGAAPGGAAPARFASLATCLKKYGVTLPSFAGRRFGATGATGFAGRFGATGARGFFGGGGTGTGGAGGLAANPKLAAALRKCVGAGGFGAGGRGTGGFDASSSQERAEISTFVACMKTNGVDLPKPNFSGKGSVFGTKVNQTSTTYTTAYAKCGMDLKFLTSGGSSAGRHGETPSRPRACAGGMSRRAST